MAVASSPFQIAVGFQVDVRHRRSALGTLRFWGLRNCGSRYCSILRLKVNGFNVPTPTASPSAERRRASLSFRTSANVAAGAISDLSSRELGMTSQFEIFTSPRDRGLTALAHDPNLPHPTQTQ
jgi:hypothetical protein